MTDRVRRLFSTRPPAAVVDAVVVAAALADVVANLLPNDPALVAVGIGGCVALLLRRRLPLLAFALTLPLAAVQELAVAPLIALFALGARSTRRTVPLVGLVLYVVAAGIPWPFAMDRAVDGDLLAALAYSTATGAAAVLFGRLVRAREALLRRLADIERAEQHERELYAETVVAAERVRLAREMHDVVSHQVSLIAVQAGALQVTAADELSRTTARTIRGLCVTTLDELRSMVLLLRASAPASGPAPTHLAPQPTLRDLAALIEAAGTHVRLTGEAPPDLPVPVQRALYRTVQECLTNARKHAPGADVDVELVTDDDSVGVRVTNRPGSVPPLGLPGTGHGLVGLRERAESLAGRLDAGPTPEGGWSVRLSVPRRTG